MACSDWEVRDSNPKGRGLFAARDFRIGECVISEAPLVVGIRNWRGAWIAVLALAAVGWLLTAPGESLFGWACKCTAITVLRPILFVVYEATYLWRSVRALAEPKQKQYYSLLSGLPFYVPGFTELRIYRLNAVLGSDSGCVCATVSMVNHCCRPNAAFSWNATSGQQEVQAIRAIAKGEEIMTSYIDLWQTTDIRRKALRSALEFSCSCPACEASAFEKRRSDERRSRCRELEMRLRAELQKENTPEAVKALKELRSTAREELGVSQHLILQEMDHTLADLIADMAEKH